jgi:hypothetical protein
MLEFKEVTIYSVDDCRSLTHAEILGIMSVDCTEEYNYDFLRSLVKNWTITCRPNTKELVISNSQCQVIFTPHGEKGITVSYHSLNVDFVKDWDVNLLMDFLGE